MWVRFVENLDAHMLILGEPFFALTNAQLSRQTRMGCFTVEGESENVEMDACSERHFPVINKLQAKEWLKSRGSGSLAFFSTSLSCRPAVKAKCSLALPS